MIMAVLDYGPIIHAAVVIALMVPALIFILDQNKLLEKKSFSCPILEVSHVQIKLGLTATATTFCLGPKAISIEISTAISAACRDSNNSIPLVFVQGRRKVRNPGGAGAVVMWWA